MERTGITSSLLLLLAAAPLAAAGPSELDAALKAFRAGELEKALELAGKVPAGADDFARAAYLAGEAQLLLHEPLAAESSFTKVLELRPQAVPAMVGLARALCAQEQYAEAELHLAAALEIDEDDLAARRALGEVALWTGRLDQAKELLLAVHREDERNPASTRAVVELWLRADELEKAGDVVERFVSKQKKHPLGYFLRGLVLERRGEVDEAIAAYQQALEKDERYLDAHKNLAILCHTQSDTYQILERNALALKHYARYFELGGGDEELEKTYLTLKAFLEKYLEEQ